MHAKMQVIVIMTKHL